MKRKTHTFFYLQGDENKCHSDSRKLKAGTLLKRGAVTAWHEDIDTHSPSKGYFNRQYFIIKGKEV